MFPAQYRSSLDSANANKQVLTADLTLSDYDLPLQALNPGTANRSVSLPGVSKANHQFVITNLAAATYTIAVESGGITLATLNPGETVEVVSDSYNWRIIGGSGSGGSVPILHALDDTSAHSIGSLTSGYLVKSDGTKLAPATNTDVQVADTVSKSQTGIVSATEPATTKVGLIWVDIS